MASDDWWRGKSGHAYAAYFVCLCVHACTQEHPRVSWKVFMPNASSSFLDADET